MPEYQRWKGIMKCYPFEEKRLAKWTPPYIVQPKFDGVRCRAIPIQTGPTGNEYILVSSEENLIFSVPHINHELRNFGFKHEFDGELYFHGYSFEEILSITSRTVNIHEDYLMIQLHIFDIVNDQPQMKRQLMLEEMRGLSRLLPIAPFWLCNDLDEIMRAYDKLIEMKYEGIVVRNAYATYEIDKRSRWVMKFKPKKKDEYIAVGWNEEVSKDGIPKGRIGSIICASQLGDEFAVSAGLNDEQREKLWKVRDQISGCGVIVHYQHLTNKQIPKGSFDLEIPELGIV